jgi:DNA-binding NarL/FixJ family response regulator
VTTSQPITRVVLVDDHQLLLELLADAIGQLPEFEVVGRFTAGVAFLRAAKSLACDVVVLDLMMPDLNGLECVRSLRRSDPSRKILIVSGNTHALLVSRALQLGVKGYVEKSAPTEEILTALRTVAAGKTYFGRSMQAKIRKLHDSPFPLDAADRLSSRERTVLAGIAAGQTSKTIAAALGLSEFTVKNHRRRIKKKTGLQTNAELIRHATSLQLVEPDTL